MKRGPNELDTKQPEKKLKTDLNLPALNEDSSQEDKIRYGGGILMAANLPSAILAHILSFLPAMNKIKAEKFIKLSAENHPEGLMQEITRSQPWGCFIATS